MSSTSDLDALYTEKPRENIANYMLLFRRNYIINVKANILNAIIAFASCPSWWGKVKATLRGVTSILELPDLTEENSITQNSRIELRIIDKFFSYLNMPNRHPLFKVLSKLYVVVCGHDGAYSSIKDYLIEEIIKVILSGEWKPRPSGWPLEKWWNEAPPYGGKQSIVYKLQQHRNEINAILERDS